MDFNNLCYIVFKYGGYWSVVKGQSRLKYVGGSQKTLKLARSDVNLLLLKEPTEALCLWLRGNAYDIHYNINGTSPKNYMPIISDTDVIDMLIDSSNSTEWRWNVYGFFAAPDLEENSLCVGSLTNQELLQLAHTVIVHGEYELRPSIALGLLGVDVCHLKSKYLGVLFFVNFLDGNNGLYTIAFVVAESESKKSWEWFLNNLSEAFSCDIEHLVFISDMEKCLGEAIKVVFPNAEHRVLTSV
ncbi:hypothetical protein M5K25_005504 [Dendrobium thyrsiflorum]|uniref:MULE transposase domain-containing protein n=1 Tax=Dendrobium thyrsiflorum TaxID=117978 RepID=A0ABD0VI42_DENTH